MRIKTAVRLITNAQLLLLLGIVAAIAAILSWSREGRALALEFSLGGGGVLLFFSRSIMVSLALRTSKYPGVLYAILEEMKQTQRLDITLTDAMLDEIHRPPYPTAQLLQDNKIHPKGEDEFQFTEQGLHFPGVIVPWRNIAEWKYLRGDGESPSGYMLITISHADDETSHGYIPLETLQIDRIEMLIVLIHFKGKYGNQ
ncbi:hypothetical protein Q4E93_18540 [Flavitalea sp. BT771]|uniref:hypothetical protein n=1 Tax=Flavitalea sp. BT771 TaxID=3063329 RepID=UPI0026E1224D|nr:hypothetical protein [Flavitalea sp. BT771]MDO6432611.1 hypothetical protein [Flavitalea sp. BT771]MDV6222113.1 hypothetical protein [Flavitalea sp. BT771]